MLRGIGHDIARYCTSHVRDSMDYLRAKYPDIGVMITGDFNRMNINHLCRGQGQ